MTHQDAVTDLVRMWDLLPMLVGPVWPELELSLLDALAYLVEAVTDDDRDQRAGHVLRLCLPHEPLRRALEPAVRRDDHRGGQVESVGWQQTSREITGAIGRSGRPGGSQWLIASLPGLAAGEPLNVGIGYELTIGVTDGRPEEALAAEPVPSVADLGLDADSIPLMVQVRGAADIETVKPVLALPRRGPSADLARFVVTPRPGAESLTLTAVVTHGAVFIQLLTLTVQVADAGWVVGSGSGTAAGADAVRGRADGRPLAEAFIPDGPDAALVMADDGLWLIGPYNAHAQLPYSQEQLAEIAQAARAALQEVVHGVYEQSGAAHQEAVAIPPEVYERSLEELVKAGALMFRTLFFGPSASEELKHMGRALERLMMSEGPLWLEVVAKSPVLPWHLLAFPDADAAAGDPSNVLGLRHRVTYWPMYQSMRRGFPARSLRQDGGPLRVVLALNRDIDERDGVSRDLVQGQIAAWQRRADAAGGALSVAIPPEREVLDALVRNTPPAELFYILCHAHSDPEPDRPGPLAACLEFTNGFTVSLRDLILGGSADHEFDTAPLVVLNACASAVPSARVYASFLPYLLGRGARGVIGTEADIPAVLAVTWASEFFERLLDGVPLAAAAFDLNRDLVRRYRNLLGLVYALHCDGRNLIWPAIPREQRAAAVEA